MSPVGAGPFDRAHGRHHAPRLVSWVVAALVVLGCERASTTEGTATPEPAPVAEAPASTAPADATSTTCGPEGERFVDLDWVPHDARFVALIALDDPGLDAAARQMADVIVDAQVGLPVFAQFELDSLGLGTSGVTRFLDAGGLRPAHLTKLISPSGLPVWTVPSSCDLGELSDRAEAAWDMSIREAVDGRVGTAPDDAGVPFDLVVLAGDRIALTPKGRNAEVRTWLSAKSDTTAGTIDPERGDRPASTAIGAQVFDLEAAPFRMAFQGRSLIAPGTTVVREDPSAPRTMRGTPDGVWIDGTLR